ncbi:LysR substrate-binding domain-containing protein [Tsukamurella sp. 8F]|uniref:LysR substrate-binding domain-containing protein n=1 Tax=unclassified Tsukamurella TaxID=2633480 RepID=UPI0023B885E9|nr:MULTISPECIES: LysR substrate-binding domain-containing protein [unclassified Tsukamurella]MDF0532133.1 LysR substrate-binding domain-containing protein [Tsukamurella sp. 8J]MDF0585174.1 LysR substrate-binding domain-containing protein [Tsukamurella sp. 8F]
MTSPRTFRLAYVPGVTPAKWVRIWSERRPDVPLELVACAAAEATSMLSDRRADAAVLRLPVGPGDAGYLHTVTLYAEATVAVVPKDHVITAADEITAADLADEQVVTPRDDTLAWPVGEPVSHRPDSTPDALELVAAGVGLVVVPQSLARMYHRRDLTYRPVKDAPSSTVALAWPRQTESELVDEFVGIVRGRTANSSRGQDGPQPKRTAREKTLAKQAARAAAGKTPPTRARRRR